MNLKIAFIVAIFSLVFVNTVEASTHRVDSDVAVTSPYEFGIANITSPISSFLKNIFKKNLEEKRENLERNRDIRNKLIEEKTRFDANEVDLPKKSELNIKFNLKKYELKEEKTDTILLQFNDSIENLEGIKDRIDSQIAKFEEESIDVAGAQELTLLASTTLGSAKNTLNMLTSTTSEVIYLPTNTASTTSVSRKDLLNTIINDIKSARELLIKAVDSFSL